MLSELIVSNIGGIKDATLNFRGNFIAITGESGAGKSSLVRALELASGKRAQSAQIRAGVDEAEVQAVLEMDGPVPSLPDDLQPQEGFMVIRRLVSSTGRARSYLQERPVPLNIVNSALSNVIAIQSQFAQLGLLEPSRQVEMLDNSGGPELKEIRSRLSMTVALALETERKLIEINRRRRETEAACQDGESFLARYRNLKLEESSFSEWETTMNDISTSLRNQKQMKSIHDRLTGGSSGEGILSSLESICRESVIAAPSDEPLYGASENLLRAAQEFEDVIKTIVCRSNEQELQNHFDDLETRLGMLRKLMRFAKTDNVNDLVEYAERTKAGLDWLKESNQMLAKLQEESTSYKKEVSSLALSLREMRRKAALNLEEAVNSTLRNLAMEGLRFGISLNPLEKVRQNGADEVSFFLTDDKHLYGPVAKTASGGELSRILLSLQIASSDEMLPDVLVFDEVEAGLGGRAAVLAGYALKELSKRCQVLLITHEASIAALADQHFKVEREGDTSRVMEVDHDSRVLEISRMLAGNPDDPEASRLASSLLGARNN